MKIDIGAALRAERAQRGVGRLAANRANALGGIADLGFDHERNMGRGATRTNAADVNFLLFAAHLYGNFESKTHARIIILPASVRLRVFPKSVPQV
jgi:hypothetical protein